jgi:hypothetical protein
LASPPAVGSLWINDFDANLWLNSANNGLHQGNHFAIVRKVPDSGKIVNLYPDKNGSFFFAMALILKNSTIAVLPFI